MTDLRRRRVLGRFTAALARAAMVAPFAGCSVAPAERSSAAETAAPAASGSDAPSNAPRASSSGSTDRILRVGPSGDVRRIAQAARLARDGDTIEVEAGDYVGDVAVWTQRRLTVRAVGGPVRLIADGAHAEGKGTWVVRNADFEVEGVEFIGSKVPDRNGAGIRFDGGRLTVRRCRFLDNENGILTGNDGVSGLLVDQCEFSGNGHGDGYSHNLYAGRIARVTVTASWFARARVGHLLKTRARESFILYNRLSDETGGRASYELEFPNGGSAVVIGNLIVQEPTSQNSTIVAFGAEGYPWPRNEFVFVHNTVVNRRHAGVFLRVGPGNVTTTIANNLFVGQGTFAGVAPTEAAVNPLVTSQEFRDALSGDYRLRQDSALRGKAIDAGRHGERLLRPAQQYVPPASSAPISLDAVLSPGAFQD